MSVAVPEELTTQLLGVAGASVTGVDIDVTVPDAGTLGPEVTVARVELTGHSGTRHVAAGLGLGLAIAVTAGAPIRVPDAAMDRLGAPVAGDDLLTPFLDRVPPAGRERVMRGKRPRYEPRNMDFADGLDRWNLEVPEGYMAGVEGQSATPVVGRLAARRKRPLAPGDLRRRLPGRGGDVQRRDPHRSPDRAGGVAPTGHQTLVAGRAGP